MKSIRLFKFIVIHQLNLFSPDKQTIAAVSAFKIFSPKFTLLTLKDLKKSLSLKDHPPTGPIKIAILSFFFKE